MTRRKWRAKTGAKASYIEPGSPWEHVYCESCNSKLRNGFPTGIFYSIKELRVLAERWRVLYDTIRPRSGRNCWNRWQRASHRANSVDRTNDEPNLDNEEIASSLLLLRAAPPLGYASVI